MTLSAAKKKPLKKRKCKAPECNEMVVVYNSLEPFCSPKCGYIVSQIALEKKAKKEALTKKRERIAIKKAFNENDKKYVEKRARAYLHRWIKWRDGGLPCIACGRDMSKLPSRAVHASHYRPSGMNSAVRYHEDNIHLGCSQCNEKKSGNLVPYRINLIDKIGIKQVEFLETQNQVHRWTIEALRDIRDDYARRLKALGIPLPSVK